MASGVYCTNSSCCSCPIATCDYLLKSPKCHLLAGERITGFTCSGSYGINKIVPESLRVLPGLAWVAFVCLVGVYFWQAICLARFVWVGREVIMSASQLEGQRPNMGQELGSRVEGTKKLFVQALHVSNLVMKLTMAFLALAADKSSELSVSLIITLLIAGLFINNSVVEEQVEPSTHGELAIFTSIEALVFILCLSLLNCDKPKIRIATAAFIVLVIMWGIVLALGCLRSFASSFGGRFDFWVVRVDWRPFVAEVAAILMFILGFVHLESKRAPVLPGGHREYRVEDEEVAPIIATMSLTLVVVIVVWLVKLTKYWGAVVEYRVEGRELQQRGTPKHVSDGNKIHQAI